MASPAEVRLAYRHLLTASYRAVKFSKPGRYVMLDRLRTAFRTNSVGDYDSVKLARTLEFLRGAAAVNGIEHRLLRNLTHYWWQDLPESKKSMRPLDVKEHRERAQEDVNEVLREMGRTMNIYV
ncbi:DUF1763-domain-containing protein [Myriangium duriaei CBS 260.36]|uniref:DUF1763-domain-containing protein n=1 Tax=Myriangium duriaei CBS 260.36 TaxID=1168546 RepID=A0A9P4J0I0_9PEZI|nr:DUF1763-domain-containing protein [Myriangium duriaei CBS 260.36]